ncbi:hypothetical protein V6N12_011690 [Hibiscus sabdariffa]|uniref:Uncharacterized protein n=1 Tax=Hibiscus sabdariffa TaxID=183260 RepID=A0ABR2B5U3_9ROSI
MEKAKLENQGRRLENQRMALIVRQKELELVDVQHYNQPQQHSSNRRGDPSSITDCGMETSSITTTVERFSRRPCAQPPPPLFRDSNPSLLQHVFHGWVVMICGSPWVEWAWVGVPCVTQSV